MFLGRWSLQGKNGSSLDPSPWKNRVGLSGLGRGGTIRALAAKAGWPQGRQRVQDDHGIHDAAADNRRDKLGQADFVRISGWMRK